MSTGNNKFSRQLQTSKRTRLTEQRVSVSELGAWNPDATDASRNEHDFAEVRNMRKMRPNELETRSGYKQWRFEGWSGISAPFTVLARAEYRLNDVFVDVTLFSASDHQLHALIVQPSQDGGGGSAQAAIDVANTAFSQVVTIAACGTTPIATAKQFGTYLIVSMIARDLADPLDCGLYALAPATGDITLQQPWNVQRLGKSVSPCPSKCTFPTTITGPLLAIPALPFDTNDPHYKQKIDPTTNEPVTVPLPIDAKYFSVEALTGSVPISKYWRYGKTDAPPSNQPANNANLHEHTKSRGWMYRVVLKRKFKDARNQEHIEVEAPSPDFYVEDRIYSPAGIGFNTGHGIKLPGSLSMANDGAHYLVINNGPVWRDQIAAKSGLPAGSFDVPSEFLGTTVDGNKFLTAFPSTQDYFDLREKFRALYPTIGDGDSLFFAAAWLGWVGSPHSTGNSISDFGPHFYNYDGDAPPYKLDARCSEINNAPNAIFSWADFGITDPTAYAIDIYRTSYTLPDESKDLAAGLPYQPYNYGLVGTLYKTDGTFTDNIPDANLLMAKSPLDAEGFLQGQLAGEVLQTYQGVLVLANVRSKYAIRTPWQGAQCAVTSVATGKGYTKTQLGPVPSATFPAAGGHWGTMWFFAYQDQDGTLSNAAPIPFSSFLQGNPTLGMFPNGVFTFVLPRGYSTTITSAALYRAVFNLGTNQYDVYRETVVPLMNGIYTSDGTTVGTLIGSLALDGTGSVSVNADGSLNLGQSLSTDDPGSIFWSDLGDAWSWPQKHFEDETDQDPIKAMESEIGPLYILSDKGVVMTRLNGYQEPVHTSGTGAGCLSRYGMVKIDATLYSLASCGLTKIDGSGSFPFPANVQSLIWQRLQERVIGQSPFSGVRDLVSLSYLPKRGEMWITFPATATFSAATYIVKTLVDTLPDNAYRDEVTRRSTYQFDIACPQPWGPATNPPMPHAKDTYGYAGTSPQPNGLVIHLPHADGSMWSAWSDPGDTTNPDPNLVRQPALVVQDNDRPDLPWPGQASLQWQNAMGAAGVQKRIDGFRFNATVLCDLFFLRGMLRTDGVVDPLKNTLMPQCQARQLAVQGSPTPASGALGAQFPVNANDQFPSDPSNPNLLGNTAEYTVPIAHDNLIEAVGTPPAIRLVTRPVTTDGSPLWNKHMLRIQSMDIWFDYDHNHKP